MKFQFIVSEFKFDTRSHEETKVEIIFDRFFNHDVQMELWIRIRGKLEGAPKELDFIDCEVRTGVHVPKDIGDKISEHWDYLVNNQGIYTLFKACGVLICDVLESNPLDYNITEYGQGRKVNEDLCMGFEIEENGNAKI